MIVAFMGGDGSGKTTTSKLVYIRLKEMGSPVEYRRGFEYFLLGLFVKPFGRSIEPVREKFLTRNISKPAYFKLWPLLVWADLWIAFLFFKLFRKKTVIIFDRYVYDFLVSWEYFGCSDKLVRKLYLSFPKPELAFVLDAYAEVAFKRSKYDHKFPYYFYSIQRKRYLTLAKSLGLRVLDTRKPVETIVNEVMTTLKDFGDNL